MKKNTLLIIVSIILSFFIFSQAWAHCDTYEGPVIKSAQKALEENNINLVLLWVEKKYESEIREAFEETLENRLSDSDADHHFFEILVEAHRLWEWEAYTWIKPKGTAIAEIVKATDKAIETKSLEEALSKIQKATEHKAEEMLHKVLETKNYDINDVEAWRAYVKAYVEYTHYVEILHNIAEQGTSYLHTLHGGAEGESHDNHLAHNEDASDDIMKHLHEALKSESELKTKFKKKYIVKYWKIINSLNQDKLKAVLEKIDDKIFKVHTWNYETLKKEQLVAALWALYDIINTRLEAH